VKVIVPCVPGHGGRGAARWRGHERVLHATPCGVHGAPRGACLNRLVASRRVAVAPPAGGWVGWVDCRPDAACIRPAQATPRCARLHPSCTRAALVPYQQQVSVCVCVPGSACPQHVAVCVGLHQSVAMCVITCGAVRAHCTYSGVVLVCACVWQQEDRAGRYWIVPPGGLTSRPSARRCSTISGGSIACE
jgi:hypothetical protein